MDALQETMLEQSLMNIDWEKQYWRLYSKYESLWKTHHSYKTSEAYFKAESEKPVVEDIEVNPVVDFDVYGNYKLMREVCANAEKRFNETHKQ